MLNISVVVLTKNEEIKIKDCLENLKWCDEKIVVDDNSDDKTVEIARKMGAKTYVRSLDTFSNQRNFGLSKAGGEWVLFVDADEKISDILAFEISNVIFNWTSGIENAYQGFYIPRIDNIWGKDLKYGESRIRLLRLAKKEAGEWRGMVHEKWKIKGKMGTLRNSLIHYPHQNIKDFLKEINFYATLRAEELHSNKIKTNIFLIITYPFVKFVINYFLKRGFLDRIPGLVHALIMSFHSFLVRGKLWLMWNKNQERKNDLA